MGKTEGEILEIGSSEYLGWAERHTRIPFAAERAERDAERTQVLLATLATITANANRDPEESPKPFTVYDFAPWLKRVDAPDTTEEEVEKMELARKNAHKAELEATKRK